MASRRKKLEVWFAKPLKFVIIELINLAQGRISFTELMEQLKKIYDNISINQVNRTLMALEIEGIIHVEVVSPKERIIEKITREGAYLPVTED